MGCGSTFMKIVLVIVNIIFFLASALMLAFGITGKANPDLMSKAFDKFLPEADQGYLKQIGVNLTDIVVDNSTFMIIVGVVGIVISLFGLIGACCEVRWMLVAYAIVLIILLLAEIALIIFAAVYSDSFKKVFQDGMVHSLTTEFKREIVFQNSSNNVLVMPSSGVELAWASIQIKYKCCGAKNYTDYQTAANWNRTLSATYLSVSVPLSCCTAITDGKLQLNATDQNQVGQCLNGNTAFIHPQNCYDAMRSEISDFIRNYKGIAIGIAAGICALELILITFAFCLCHHANRSDKFV